VESTAPAMTGDGDHEIEGDKVHTATATAT